MPEIELAVERCTGCGLCEDFCPVKRLRDGVRKRPLPAARGESRGLLGLRYLCGSMPTGALRVVETFEPVSEPVQGGELSGGNGHYHQATPLSEEEQRYIIPGQRR